MAEEGRPTGITFEDAEGLKTVDFEGRQAEIVHFSQAESVGALHTARVELDFGDGRLVLSGYFSSDNEFIELNRARPD